MIIFDFNINILSIHLPRGPGQGPLGIFEKYFSENSRSSKKQKKNNISGPQNGHNFNIVLSIFNIKKLSYVLFFMKILKTMLQGQSDRVFEPKA